MTGTPRSSAEAARPRPRTVALACAVALLGMAGGVSASFAQAPSPPAPPSPPTAPTPPSAPDAEPSPSPSPEEPSPSPSPQDPEPSPTTPAGEGSSAGPAKLKPFPVVVIAGRVGERTTRVTELAIRGPEDARVRMRCLGEVCPVRRVRNTIGSSGRLRLRRAERVYRAGTAIEIRVTAPDRVGKYTKVKFRRGRTPLRTDACLQPGETEPSPCPSG